MHCLKSGAIGAALLSGLWLTGCVNTSADAQKAELKRSTMQRWTACLERNADVRIMPSKQLKKLLHQDCEGHKRDVLALYPPNMAGQVDQMLVSSAVRVIDAMSDSKEVSGQSDGLVDTALP